jgi:hypothetical protein
MAVVFPFHLPQENQNFSFIDLKGNVNSGKAAKFLAEVSYYIASPFQRGRSFVRVLFVFLIVHVVGLYPCKVLETLQENYKSIKTSSIVVIAFDDYFRMIFVF